MATKPNNKNSNDATKQTVDGAGKDTAASDIIQDIGKRSKRRNNKHHTKAGASASATKEQAKVTQGNVSAAGSDTDSSDSVQDGYSPSPYINRVIRFMKFRKPMAVFSLLVVLIGIGALAVKGLNLGLDFTGGVSAELIYDKPVKPNDVAAALEKAGFANPVVQYLDSQSDIQLRIPPQEGEGLAEKLTQAVQLPDNTATVAKVDAVGAQVGNELYARSLGALALALACMMLYIAVRYQFKLAVGAVISLVHDVLFVVGIFALMGWPFDFAVLAAVLALIGYSLNDTIVVFDRIRENFRKIRGVSAVEIVDISLTETLRRTIMTVVTVIIVVVCMYFLGGDGLKWFSVALMVGLFAGTYSSVYIASAYSLWAGLDRSDFVVKVKPEFEEEVVEFE